MMIMFIAFIMYAMWFSRFMESHRVSGGTESIMYNSPLELSDRAVEMILIFDEGVD